MLSKKRQAKNSERGIYVQDRQLQDTVFQPGTHFKYVIDRANRQIVILAAEDAKNTVSKRLACHDCWKSSPWLLPQ